ncbi:MAG: phage tail tape measure C-terminal domain-containing protein [Pseudomonadota bacterium]
MTTIAEANIVLGLINDPQGAANAERARQQITGLGAATRQSGEAAATATQQNRQLATTLGQAAVQQERMTRATLLGNRGLGAVGGFARQAGLQVQDMAVQFAAGTNSLIIMTQQVPQLLGILGPLGAGLGAIVAIGGAVALTMTGLAEGSEEAEAALERLKETTDRLRDLQGLGNDLDSLIERYGVLTAAVRELLAAQQEQERFEAQRAAQQAIVNLSPGFNTDIFPGFRDGSAELQRSFLPIIEQLNDLRQALGDSTSFEERARLAAELRNRVLEVVGGVQNLNDEGRALNEELIAFEEAMRAAAGLTQDTEAGLADAVRQASGLASELERAEDALRGLTNSASSDLATAEIRLQFRTDPIAQARALAELEAQSAITDIAGASDALGLPGAARRQALAAAQAEADRIVADRVRAAEFDAERQRLDQLDRERDRENRRSGGRGSRSQRNVAGEIEAEIRAIDRLRAARTLGAAAVQEALIVEEQAQALRRAGLSIGDLEGGHEQARAQRIAELSRALFEREAAERASAEVTRAYAAEVGASYTAMRTELESWRDETLLALETAGEGNARYAAQVEELFQRRLEEAYKEDLERRTDWAAGVERGLDQIVSSTGTMADLAEEAVVTGFRSMEDAFVSLATTGKVQVSDLVEYTLRQFYRLSLAAAQDLAGGGSGGILGDILGAIGGAVLGSGTTLNVGSGTAGTFLGGGGATFTGGGSFPAGVLHAGGGKGDATIGFAPASAFAFAPKYHQGFGPREFPAILEDTERVLTAAQQDATARTIDGQARVIEAMSGSIGVATGALPVTVNVYGVDGNAEASASQGSEGLQIDVIIEQLEGRMGQRIAQGRGLAQPIQNRFELRPTGAR